MLKRIVLAVVALVVPTFLWLPAPAHAITLCPSNNTLWEEYTSGGTLVATLCQSNSSGSWTLQSQGRYRGLPKTMSLKVCVLNRSGQPANCRQDSGTYSYYAGPVAFPGGCPDVTAVMYDGRGHRIVNDHFIACD